MLAASGKPGDNDERLEFLLRLSDLLRGISDPLEAQSAAVRLLGEFLAVDRAGYAEVDAEDDSLHVLAEWRCPGVASMLGTWQGPQVATAVCAMQDAANEPQALEHLLPPAKDFSDTRAAVVYRLLKQDRMVAALFVHQSSPRRWTEMEIALVAETAERAWEAVDRARALEQLRQSEQKLRRLFDSMDEGFCIIEVLFDDAGQAADFRYLEVNVAFERHTGLHHAVGRRARELTPQLEQHWFDVYGGIALKGEPARFELPAESLGHWYEVYAFRIGDPAQRQVAIIFDDITHRVLNEAALRESERRCRGLAADSARLLDAERAARCEADRAMRAKDEFLATVSHELRTPLANIVSWSRLLCTRFLGDEEMLRKGLTVVSDNAISLGRLLSGLLDSCRISSGKFELEPEELDLNGLLASVHAGLLPSAESRGITLSFQPAEAPAPLYADPIRLRQVVDNLLSNAIKFSPAGGTIALCCSRTADGKYIIEVCDSGQGIDAALLPHVFDRFRQADFARARGHGGLGLGLSIARQIVDMHGGSIEAFSEGPGRGSRFVVTLPVRAAENAVDPSAAPAEAAGIHALRGLSILAVEDQPEMRELLKRILEDHDAQVTVAASATEALTLLRQAALEFPFDLLISDIGLPNVDGNQLIRIVRQDLGLEGQQLPAIAVTAYARMEDRQRALDAGFQEHVTKPYGAIALLQLVHRLTAVRRRELAAESSF